MFDDYKAKGNFAPYSSAMLDWVRITGNDANRLALLQAEINKYFMEAFVAFIQNGVTDATWNNFISTLKRIGVEEYIALYQKAYDVYIK